jgi:hypothetical protein
MRHVMNKDKQPAGRRLARNAATARYLNITPMTLWRWKRSSELRFPPAYVVNGIDHNDLDLIDRWLMKRAVDHTLRKQK